MYDDSSYSGIDCSIRVAEAGISRPVLIRRHPLLPLIALILVCPQFFLQAAVEDRQARFQRFGGLDGLPQNRINAILQDRPGYMWFGCQSGLFRFDAYRFVAFQHRPGDTTSLPENDITRLFEDADGALWLISRHGILCSYDRRRQSFRPFRAPPHGPRRVSALSQDAEGRLLIASRSGRVFSFDKTSGVSKPVFSARNPSGWPRRTAPPIIRDFAFDSAGVLWLGSSSALHKLDRNYNELSSYPLRYTRPAEREWQGIWRLMIDRTGELWIGTAQGLLRFDREGDSLRPMYSGGDGKYDNHYYIPSLCQDASGRIWLASGHGLLHYDPALGIRRRFLREDNNPHSLSSHMLSAVYADRFGTLWVGSSFGLNKLSLREPNFAAAKDFLPSSAPPFMRISSVSEDSSGNLWLGSSGRLFEWPAADPDSLVQHPQLITSLRRHAPIYDVLHDRHGDLWVGSASPELIRFDSRADRLIRYREKVKNHAGIMSLFFKIFEARDGGIWIAGIGELLRYNRADDTFSRYFEGDTAAGVHVKDYLFDIAEDSSGSLWVAGSNGLLRFDRRAEKFTRHYLPRPNDSTSLSASILTALYVDAGGRLWIGSKGGGLNRYDASGDAFQRIGMRDGLPSNWIRSIAGDRGGALWLGTDRGLARYDPARAAIRSFDVGDGLHSNEFTPRSACLSPSTGRMYFGGFNGLTAFHPDRIHLNPNVPPLVVNEVRVFDKALPISFDDGDTVRLPYDSNFVSFEFAALDYTNPRKHNYAYKLDGLDKDWVYCGTRRLASYTNLRGGDYVFRVRGSNNDGIWNDTGLIIHLQIRPPFWDTLPFRIIVFSGLLAIAALLVQLRIRTVKRKALLQRQLLESELQSLRLKLNPHFIFNSLHTIQHYIIHNEREQAYDHLASFAQLMRDVLDSSGRDLIPLADELAMLRSYLDLEGLRFAGRFSYTIDVDDRLQAERQMIPPLLLQPFVENALRHGLRGQKRDGRIRISIRRQTDLVICHVEDNGIGRPDQSKNGGEQDSGHRSHGIHITRERLRILGERCKQDLRLDIIDLRDADGDPAGTRVSISIPLDRHELIEH